MVIKLFIQKQEDFLSQNFIELKTTTAALIAPLLKISRI